MAVPEQFPTREIRKRKRRRRQDKLAISARLVLEDHVKGDIGIFSDDLFYDLFPEFANGGSPLSHANDEADANLELQIQMKMTIRKGGQIILRYRHGHQPRILKIQSGLLSRFDPPAGWRILRFSFLRRRLPFKDSPSHYNEMRLRNLLDIVEMGLKYKFWM